MADRARMEELSKRFETKSDKIRVLNAAGYSRVEIKDFLGIRYQHVRNVLVRSEKKSGADGGRSGLSSAAIAQKGIRNRVRLKVDRGGRVLIPADIREAMGLTEGSTVLAWLDGGELRLVSPKVALQQVQELARELMGTKGSLADELIAERREEARREATNG